ncbi:hypothetical protein AKJ18_13945 [Vibrio xuii]|nr:hypothetical protein AKJ18_13945 [Vibrio xuii]
MFKNKNSQALVAIALLATAGTASAALPADAQAAMDSVGTFVTDILAAAWIIATSMVTGFVGIKLFKKGASKAT